MEQAASNFNLKIACEIFADRNYEDDGNLVSRKKHNALITNPDEAKKHVLRMVENQALNCHSGKQIPCEIDSICIHGDNQSSLDTAIAIKKNLIENNINSIDEIRKKNNFVVSFSNEMKKNCDIIKKFLFDKVYNHSHLSDKRQYSKKVISTLFTYFVKNNNKLPVDWRNQNIEIERLICDYISGMTDRFALNLYKEISE